MSRERRLGRGLEALLSQPMESDAPPTEAGDDPLAGAQWVDVYQIDRNPFQPRKAFDEEELGQLAQSIAEHGMLQPVVLRRRADRFQLISGERRWRAATIAGWEKVPAQVREADDRQMAEVAIVENIQRTDLNPLEKAASFRRYLDEYQCTQEELAARVHVDRSTIANLIRLLDLPEPVRQAVLAKDISQGHARALLSLAGEREQIDACRRIAREGLSVRAAEQLVKELNSAAAGAPPLGVVGGAGTGTGRKRSEHLAVLEQEFKRALGTKVELREGARGKGKIVIHFTSHDEFDRLRAEITDVPPSPRQTSAG